MAQHITSVDLKEVHQPWLDYCAQHGLDRAAKADFLRRAISEAIHAEAKPKPMKGGLPSGKRKWLRVSMTAENYDRLTAAAAVSRAGSISEYLTTVAEAAAPMTIRKPVSGRGLSPETIAAVSTSNVNLLAIGRNLNQIAKSLNMYPGQTTEKDRTALRSLRRIIESHVDRMSGALSELLPRGKLRGQKRG